MFRNRLRFLIIGRVGVDQTSRWRLKTDKALRFQDGEWWYQVSLPWSTAVGRIGPRGATPAGSSKAVARILPIRRTSWNLPTVLNEQRGAS
jgi:hypothetical protein